MDRVRLAKPGAVQKPAQEQTPTRLTSWGADERIAEATLAAIRCFAEDTPTVYLLTHDPQSAERLARNSRSPRQTTPA